MKKFINNLYTSISSLIKWFKVIINDRDYHWGYILLIEKHKLENVLDRLHTNKFYEDQEDIEHYLRICVYLLEDILCEDYYDGYINVRNSYEYKKLVNSGVDKNILKEPHVIDRIHKEKAIRLYYRIKAEKIFTWWD